MKTEAFEIFKKQIKTMKHKQLLDLKNTINKELSLSPDRDNSLLTDAERMVISSLFTNNIGDNL
ncbi:hypothetical protein HJA72_004181 [Vibrio fluvialis]|nr:hypothetical protein [Vibrio fluvialis]